MHVEAAAVWAEKPLKFRLQIIKRDLLELRQRQLVAIEAKMEGRDLLGE